MTHLVEPNENNGQIILLCQTLWDDNDHDHNDDVGYKSFFFLFWSQWFFAHFRNCPINTGLGRRTSCRDKRWSHQIWGTWCSKITHSSGPPHIRFLVPIKAFLASLEISVVYISSTCTSWFLSKTDTFLTGAMCPSYRDVRLIESQLKWAKNGRDKLYLSVLTRCSLIKSSLYFLKRETHYRKFCLVEKKIHAALQTTLFRVSLTILDWKPRTSIL